jgi:chemotaxis protein methyltransferase CheR
VTATVAQDEYVDFCEGVRALCQVDLLQYKRPQMERRLRTFAQRRGWSSLREYLLELGRTPEELAALLDRATINVSQLWRNPEQWTALARGVVPELAQTGSIRVWSAGCSYGAEAFTIAAVCVDAAPGARIGVHGTDIDGRMVERAGHGWFSDADARSAPADALARHFVRDGAGWRANDALRSLTSFETGDLLRMRPQAGRYDLVLCRNTVIYFNEPVRDALHERLAHALRPGGYLVVGSTERISDPAACGVQAVAPFTYRRA